MNDLNDDNRGSMLRILRNIRRLLAMPHNTNSVQETYEPEKVHSVNDEALCPSQEQPQGEDILGSNETALRPLLSSWDTLEKYLDGDSVLHLANTCSTLNAMFHEVEGYTRPDLPHILGQQARVPNEYFHEQNGVAKVHVKHSFLVLLMQPEQLDGEFRKVQIHFNFDYYYSDVVEVKSKLPWRGERFYIRRTEKFWIDAFRYTSTHKNWEKVTVDPDYPVTALMRQALTKCHHVMRTNPPVFPISGSNAESCKRELMKHMDDYCNQTLEFKYFHRREAMQMFERNHCCD
jgi:hypothetical protein